MNSYIQTLEKGQISPGVVICDSHIETCSVNIGTSSYISGISYLEPLCALVIPKDLAVIKVFMQNDIQSELFVIFGIQENLMAPVDLSCSFFCNKPWSSLLEHLGVEENEIWNSNLSSKERRLLNAKLYSTNLSIVEALTLYHSEDPSSKEFLELVKRWKKHEHYSIEDILERINYSRVFQNRRNMYNRVSSEIVKKTLMNNEDLPLLPYYSTACCEELADFLMDALDHVLLSDASSVIKTRALSHMADLLSVMAGITGGLRSGPGNNPAWTSAFTFLMNSNIIEGMKALQNERSNWLDRPDHIMRAARHYDRAAQILILISVKTVLECIVLSPSSLPDIGTYITAECPARIDLQGGWSDTPPICYELGGSVVNVAVLIDGKKPIGARARRIIEPHILLKLGLEEMCHEVLIKDIKDVLNYDQPNAQGALLKAALLCTEIVNVDSHFTLSQQLMSRFSGGFEVQAWSLLPQGCGMGTSSILAGAIVSVLWTVSGKAFDKLAIIHAVLYVEQLLTTGGGWQDQVSGVLGGITRGYSEAVLPLCVKYEPISLPEELIAKLNSHLLLLYTGKVRLAKNLLQNVIRSWYAREEIVVNCFKDLISYSLQMKQALKNGDFYQIGFLMNKYWEQKKILAPGCEPATVKGIMDILSSLCYGQLLVGAGGGGFMCILTKEPNDKANIKAALHNFKDSKKLSIHTVNIDLTGLEIQKSP
ncbi:L-fucose kinase-like [Stegodyphus dumicola]|uniref:L-fucose kinase-like n=1 Tax=Stegodyphus dumicola TaxID=202533 RepID=UPI0015AEC3F3|nr:L-fucose kinase-like [Stegodyphus dumicola]